MIQITLQKNKGVSGELKIGQDDWFIGSGFPFGVMPMFWNPTVLGVA